MAGELEISKGLKVTTNVEADAWQGPYASVADANTAVPSTMRLNRTVKILVSGTAVDYQWKGATTDGSLVVKSLSSAAISTLTDVTLTTLSTGNFLRYNGSAWVNTLLVAGDIPSGSTNYVQNQFAGAQTSTNFWITGTAQSNIVYTNSVSYPQAANNANVQFGTTGVIINRNINDANTVLIVQQLNASATGDIVRFSGPSTTLTSITLSGIKNNLYSNYSTGSNSILNLSNLGTLITRDVAADSNPVLTVTNLNTSSTGDVLRINNFTGTVAKFDINGNLTLPLTAGSMVFAGTSGILSQDNSNFFWDNTNKRLGIGTNTPTQSIHVMGSISVQQVIASSSIHNGVTAQGGLVFSSTQGPTLSRTLADAIPVLTLTQSNASATGDLLRLANNTGTVASVSQLGYGTFVGINSNFYQNTGSSNNSSLNLTTTGATLFRSIADANPVFTVINNNASSTGDILRLSNNTGVVASFSQGGVLGLTNIINLASVNNAQLALLTTGAEVNRNINDTNPTFKVRNNNASATGDILQLFDQTTQRFAFTKAGIFNIGVAPGNTGTTFTGLMVRATTGNIESITPSALSATRYASTTGTNAYVITLAPAITALTTGMQIAVRFVAANTGACTIAINGLTAVAITKNGTTALVSGDIVANSIRMLTYDGTRFILNDMIVNAASLSDITTGTDTTRYISASLWTSIKTSSQTISKWNFNVLNLVAGATPGTMANGDIWYETTNNRYRTYIGTQVIDFVTTANNYLFQGTNPRLVQTNALGDLSATQEIADGFVSDTDVTTVITAGTYNIGNNFTVSGLTPANSKTLYQGQWYKSGADLYFAVDDNTAYKVNRAVNTLLATYYTDVSNTGTTEATVFTYSLPANTLSTNGQMIEVEAVINVVINSETSTFAYRVKLGSSTITVLVTEPIDEVYFFQSTLKCKIMRTGSTTARVFIQVISPSISSDGNSMADTSTNVADWTGLNFTTANNLVYTMQAAGTSVPGATLTNKMAEITFKSIQ